MMGKKIVGLRLKMWILLWIGSIFLSFSSIANDLLFDRIDLPYEARVVNCLYQDNQGMIWMGTKRGLFTYNGYRVNRVLEGNIHVMAGCGNDYLCYADDNGLHWLDFRTEKNAEPYEGLSIKGDVRALLMHKGLLYVGTRSSGIFLLNLEERSMVHYAPFEEKDDLVFEIEACGDDVYVANYKGLIRLTPDGRQIDCGIDEPVYAIRYEESDRTLWLGTEGHLLHYNPKDGEIRAVMSGSTINEIDISSSGDLLLASEYGLRIYNKPTDTATDIGHDVTDIRHSLPNNNVHDILRDRQQNIWVATDRGVAVTPASNNYQIIELSDLFHTNEGNFFNRILIDSRGDRWLGGDNGLIKLSEQGNRWYRTDTGLRKNVVRSIYEDRDHEIWIASDAGIARLNRGKDVFEYFSLTDKMGRNANWAYDIYEDMYGRLWVATYMGGLYVMDKSALLQSGGQYVMEKLPFAAYEDIVSTTSQICPESDTLIWLNTDKGLASVNVKNLEVSLMAKDSFEKMKVIDGSIWISAQGKVYPFGKKDDGNDNAKIQLQDGMIYDFLQEDLHVWLSTSNGLYYTDQPNSSLHSYGMPAHPFMVGAYDAKQSEIIWAGEDFICIQSLFDPLMEVMTPKVYVTSVSVEGQPMNGFVPRYTDELKLNSREDILIELSSLMYNPQRPESFWYRLGKEGEWHMLPYGSNQIALAHLSGGTYNLYLSCTDPRNTDSYTEYKLKVPYPWYFRWWAWMLYAIIAILLIAAIWQYLKHREHIMYKRRERDRMLAITQQKMDFFVNMSHELKTPLSLIIAPLSKLMTETTNARTKERLKNIHTNALRLNELIYRILDIKKMEAEGEDTLLISHVELCELLQRCISEFDEATSSKGIIVNFTSNVDSLWVNIDATKIHTTIRNLLSNAVKYAPEEGGEIDVNLTVNSSEIFIKIHDNGNGVEKDDLPKLFDRYYQGKNALEGSTGIGLSIVKKYVEMHGGKVKAENDRGLTITIELPLAAYKSEVGSTEKQADGEKPYLLLVDDNKEILDFLTSALSDHYVCHTATSGEEALQMISEQVPDLIITDQMMPEMDGTSLCKRIRHEYPTSGVPIIMLTAKDDSDTELESLRIGVDVFMPKPFDLRKLQLHIVQLLKRRQDISQSVNISHIAKGSKTTEQVSQTSDEALMEEIMHIVEDNMKNEDFNVTMLADMLKMDQKQVYRKLKQLTGMTPVVFIRRKRMQKAASLLAENRFSISEVMFRVGLSNQSYFTKCFKNEFDVLPKDYRSGHGQQELSNLQE